MDVALKNKSFNFCSECGGYIVFNFELGEEVCSKCGLVINDRVIDFSHCDKRTYNYQEKLERDQNGPPISPLTPTVGLHTVLSTNEIMISQSCALTSWNSYDRLSCGSGMMLLKRSHSYYYYYAFTGHSKCAWGVFI